MYSNERLIATCTIVETFINEIKPGMRVLCYKLSPARRPQREQRRDFFRVNVAALDLEPVKLSHTDEENEDNSFQVKARLVNLSGGGIGVCIRGSTKVLNQIKRSRTFGCQAVLGSSLKVKAPVRIAHIEAIGDDGLYLGLEFAPQDEGEAKLLEELMIQRCTEFQRIQLKKRRA